MTARSTAKHHILGLLTALFSAGTCAALEFHVAPKGDDGNPGTSDQPFATVAHARDAVRSTKQVRRESIEVIIHEGTYYLPETLAFTAEDSGSKEAPVIYRAEEGDRPVISGGVRIDVVWQPHRGGIMKAKLPDGMTADQLFIDGQRQHMARYPDYDPRAQYFNGFAAESLLQGGAFMIDHMTSPKCYNDFKRRLELSGVYNPPQADEIG